MSGFVLNALSTAGSFGYWGLRQLVHTVEINRSGPWVYPQAFSKVACLAAAYLAYYAPSSDLKKAYVACSLASLVANYAFRKVHLSDLTLASKTAELAKEKDDIIEDLRRGLAESKSSETGTAEANQILINSNQDLTRQCASLTKENEELNLEKKMLIQQLTDARIETRNVALQYAPSEKLPLDPSVEQTGDKKDE